MLAGGPAQRTSGAAHLAVRSSTLLPPTAWAQRHPSNANPGLRRLALGYTLLQTAWAFAHCWASPTAWALLALALLGEAGMQGQGEGLMIRIVRSNAGSLGDFALVPIGLRNLKSDAPDLAR
jgi:hypothetical protein